MNSGVCGQGTAPAATVSRQWPTQAVRLVLFLVAGAGSLSIRWLCGTPRRLFLTESNQAYQHGELKQSQQEASEPISSFIDSRPDWACKFESSKRRQRSRRTLLKTSCDS